MYWTGIPSGVALGIPSSFPSMYKQPISGSSDTEAKSGNYTNYPADGIAMNFHIAIAASVFTSNW